MNKSKLMLASVLMFTLLIVPIVNAAPLADSWFIDNAITSFKEAYPEHADKEFTGVVTTGLHEHGSGPHKHVTLTATYEYRGSGEVTWSGRSYENGGIYSLSYSVTEPEERSRQIKVTIHYVGGASCFYWNGKQWEYNEPVVRVEDGRTFLIYYPQL